MIGIEFQQWIMVEKKFDNFWFEQWRYKSSYQLPGFSLIYLPYIFLGQEPKFKHWEWQGNWDWVRGQENVCNCCVFRNQLRLPRHPPQWLARGQQDHTPRCGHVQVRASRVHVSGWHVSLCCRCEEGMTFSGPSYRTICQADGRWSHPVPRCYGQCHHHIRYQSVRAVTM